MRSTKRKFAKRLVTVFVAVALITCLISLNSSSILAAEQSVIRVKLSVGSITAFNFSLNGNYGIKGTGINLSGGSYSVKAEGGTLKLYCGGTLMSSGTDIMVEEHAPSAEYNYATLSTTKYGSNKYRGSLQFRLNSGKIDVINHIYLEYYLYGVVPHEMSNTWPLEALKTQAVSARTYAKRYMTGGGSYDVVDTATHQVYKGFNAANNNAIRAVDETSKMVLKCEGQLVQTFFAASNGGYVDIPQHVWSAGARVMPYHIIQPDPYDTQNTWSVQEVLIFPKDMSASSIDYKYMESGSMVTRAGTEASNAERYLKVSALPAVAAKGYIAAVTDDIRITGINSITAHTHEGQHGSVKDYNGNNTCPVYTKADVSMTVIASRNATIEEMSLSGSPTVEEQVSVSVTIDMHKFDEQGGLYQAFNNMSLRMFAVEETSGSWNLYHRRYGHGIGMSQRGAQTRAKAGHAYQQILAFYYPNTYFEALNISAPALHTPVDNSNASVINCTTAVNVRSTPDTSNAPVGSAPLGMRLNVTQPYVTATWHKISYNGSDAYIYAYYVKLDDIVPPAPPSQTPSETAEMPTAAPTETTETPTAAPTETTQAPTEAPTQTPAMPPEDEPNASVVNCHTSVNLRSTPDTSKPAVGSAPRGMRLTVAQPYVTSAWHKISFNGGDAYIYAYYVKLDQAVPSPSASPTSTTIPAPSSTPTPAITPTPAASAPEIVRTGTVTVSTLNIRSAPSTSGSKLGAFSKGSTVSVIEVESVKDWHKIWYNDSAAYVWADYVKLSGESILPAVQTTGVVTSSTLNVRSGPGTSYSNTGVLSKGSKVDITKTNYTADWHQIIYGGKLAYVHKSYISLSPGGSGETSSPSGAVYASVNASKLNFRSAANTSSKVYDTLARGAVVQVIEKGSAWHKVKYGGREGYMYSSYLRLISGVYGKVSASTLNVRSSASSSSKILGKLKQGTTVEILEKGTTWHRIKYGSGTAYVYASYIKLQ